MLGNLQLNNLDDLDAAEESYREVLRLNPRESSVREALAQVLIQQGELGEARDQYEQLRGEEQISYQGLYRSEEHTSELQSRQYLVCRLLLEKKKKNYNRI